MKKKKLRLSDLPLVGGKNSSLGEMFGALSSKGIRVPDGFAVTADDYWKFLNENKLVDELNTVLSKLDKNKFSNLSETGSAARKLLLEAAFPPELKNEIISAYKQLCEREGNTEMITVLNIAKLPYQLVCS